jgi:F-type H+-transporting ATPase subunit epsilon
MSEDVMQATIPTTEGEITVLPMHSPLVSVLAPGVVEYKRQDGSLGLASVSGGFIEVFDNQVVVMADTAERAEEIDEKRAEEARQKAEEAIQNMKDVDEVKFADFSSVIAREMARTKAVQKWRKLKNL